MTCKDCIHYGICTFHLTNEEYKKCVHFKPKSRYIELPCAVGDTVYINLFGEAQAFVVVKCDIHVIGKEAQYTFESTNGEFPMRFCENNIGKTIFLTKEEAEKALERSSNEKV